MLSRKKKCTYVCMKLSLIVLHANIKKGHLHCLTEKLMACIL